MVAAEASSSLYAQRLLEHWQRQGQNIRAFGIGSRAMEKLGFEILGRSEELAVVGIQEVLSHWSDIKQAFDRLLEEARNRRPAVALLLDYPDFNLRLAKKLKKMGIPVVYYVSPQVWAWRQRRIHLIRKVVDKVLLLFPFEKPFYDKHQVPAEFVGHPLLDEIGERFSDPEARRRNRLRYGLTDQHIVLGLMPGSRHSELKHHLKLQVEVAEQLVKKHPSLKVALMVAPTFEMSEMRQWLPQQLGISLILMKDDPFYMIEIADVVLCASGTATLMVGLLQKPMVIMYRMNAFTAWLAKKFVKSTAYFGMINLILQEEVAKELFQEKASVENLVVELDRLIVDAKLRQTIQEKLARARTALGDKGATVRVAKALEKYLTV